jgi:hypothetical protein
MKSFKKDKKILILLIIIGIFGIISGTLALELEWPSFSGGTELTDASTLPHLIQYIYEWGIAIGGLATFIALVSAGFQYLTSAGDPTKMGEARSKVTSAILGLTLLLSSWLILNTINPELTTFQSLSFDVSSLPDVQNEMDFDITEMEPCSYAEVYDEIGFEGNFITISPSDADTEIYYAKSVKAFKENGDECDKTACGCILQLAAGSWLFGWGCSDPIGYIPAYERDITRRSAGYAVKCVRLLLPDSD